MKRPSREALRRQATQFIAGPAFQDYYERAHIPRWLWVLGHLVRCLTIAGLRGGVTGLRQTPHRLFTSPALHARYRALADRGVVVEGFFVVNSARLETDPDAAAPALIVAALDGTSAADAWARATHERLIERTLAREPEGGAEREVAAMVRDDAYVACRRRQLPPELSAERTYLVDVWIDNRLLGGALRDLPTGTGHYFLVDPEPGGLSMLVPRVAAGDHSPAP